MNIKRKIAIAAVPAVMALASTSVDSKILLMSQEGWEVSFDGAANAFVMKNSVSDIPTDTNEGERLAGGFKTFGGVAGGNDDTSIVTGLLPNVWGMTLKAPTANGLDVSLICFTADSLSLIPITGRSELNSSFCKISVSSNLAFNTVGDIFKFFLLKVPPYKILFSFLYRLRISIVDENCFFSNLDKFSEIIGFSP